jgi:hypothetical protein
LLDRADHRNHIGAAQTQNLGLTIKCVADVQERRRDAGLSRRLGDQPNAIRTVRPTEPSLVARKLARMAVAPYVRRGRKRPPKLAAVSYTDGVRLPLRNVEAS